MDRMFPKIANLFFWGGGVGRGVVPLKAGLAHLLGRSHRAQG